MRRSKWNRGAVGCDGSGKRSPVEGTEDRSFPGCSLEKELLDSTFGLFSPVT